MNKRAITVLFVAHFGFSLAAWFGLGAGALGAADAGREPAGFAALDALVHGVLLQPLAHWVFIGLDPAWWTWTGLALAAGLIAVNSALVTLLVALFVRILVAWSRQA